MKSVKPGTKITLNYVEGNGNGGTTISDLGLISKDFCTADITPLADQPWFSRCFLSGYDALGFTIPATQLQDPLLPQRVDPEVNGFFHPSF